MSPCRLLEENGRAHFMTKRFDRDGNTKHHLQTLCGLAHLDYRQKAAHDVSQVLLTIDRLGLGYATSEEAFRRIAFNVIAANCDDHTKNVSFLLREGGVWELAPAYDVTYVLYDNEEVEAAKNGLNRIGIKAERVWIDVGRKDRAGPSSGEAGTGYSQFIGPLSADRLLHRCSHVPRRIRAGNATEHR